jgi:hypothetical protein
MRRRRFRASWLGVAAFLGISLLPLSSCSLGATSFNVLSTVSGFALTQLGYPSLDQWYGIQMMNK